MHDRRIPSSRTGPAVLAAAALIGSLVAFAAAAHAATTTTVRGTVTVGGHVVAGVPVGTWNPTSGVVAHGTTDSHGHFVLRSPSGISVVAYAGSKPSAAKAVLTVGEEHVVRGVIGKAAPKGAPDPLAVRVPRAVPSALGGGHALRFRLQEAGRFTASTPELGAFVDTTGEIGVLHANGVSGPRWVASAAGEVTSGWLVPGRYHLSWNGKDGSTTTWLTVAAGRTAAAPPPTWSAPSSRTTIRIRVTSGGHPVPEGVPSVRLTGSGTRSASSTDASGTLVEDVSGPGTYRFEVGRYFDDPDEGLEGPPTTDDYLARTVGVSVPSGATTADATVDLTPAAKVTGTFTAPAGTSAGVYVEDAAGDVIRAGSVDADAVLVGGLPSGTFTVFGVDLDRHRYAVETVTVTAGSTTALARPLVPTAPELTLRGTVDPAAEGSVALKAEPVSGAVVYSAFSRTLPRHDTYSVRTIPGRFRFLVFGEGHLDHLYPYATVTRSATKALRAGARTAAVAVRFTVHGHVVRVDMAAKGSGGRDFDVTRSTKGRSTAHGVAPGRYTWTSAFAPLPAADGPWSYTVPKGTFTVRAGAVAQLGTKAISIRG